MDTPSLPCTSSRTPARGTNASLLTSIGPLAPQRSTDDLRRRELVEVSWYSNGLPRSVPLEEQTMVSTPAGLMPAELVTFHPCGALKRVFPLNGRLSGYWTQEDEAQLARPVSLDTPLGRLQLSIISACFHANGALRCLALWPETRLRLATPAGELEARMAVSFHPDGRLQSLEPARPQPIPTPVGEILAFDPDAVGISGDSGSLVFDDHGRVKAISTVQSCIVVSGNGQQPSRIAPIWRESLCGLSEKEPVPLRLVFTSETLAIHNSQAGEAEPVLLPLKHCQASPLGLNIDPLPTFACGI